MVRAHLSEMTIEEVANVLTHGLGLVLSIIGFVILAAFAISTGDRWQIVGSVVYGVSLVTLYAASTIYHSTISPRRKSIFQLLDHCCIYLLIAGTYTPFLLVLVRNGFGMGMLAFVWAIAVFGIAMKVMYRDRLKALGIGLYLAMGWLALALVQPMYTALGMTPLILIVAGGLSYTAGMIFFGWKSIKHHHAIFHVFVLGGSILHYIVITAYIVARG